LGLLYRDSKRIAARIDFGVPLIDRRRSTREDLQDFGVHFSLRYRLF
jgi:hemolysin activation/secretion protein